MIAGTIVMEDITLTFTTTQGEGESTATYVVADNLTGQQATRTVPMKDFMAALAIAVHQDGDPDAKRDWAAAESVQPIDAAPALRWIP
jgi:hypothetical protein